VITKSTCAALTGVLRVEGRSRALALPTGRLVASSLINVDVLLIPQYSQRLQDMVQDMLSEYKTTIKRLTGIQKQLDEFVDESESGKILLSIPGIGVINASALLAAIDKGQAFNSPKEFAVWLGLTPKQHASGNMSKMGGITKRGDRYLRKQLVHGARSVVSRAAQKTDLYHCGPPNSASPSHLTKSRLPWLTVLLV
jgi:transposase